MTGSGRGMQPARMAVATFALLAVAAASARGFVVEMGPPALAHEAPAFDAYREFGSRDGLAQATIYALAQDTSARVWAGSELGVARYDGRRWHDVELPGPGGATPAYVYALAATDDGAVWISTDERGVYRYD